MANKIVKRELWVGGLQLREKQDGEKGRTIEGVAVVFNSPSKPLYDDSEIEIREVISPDAITRELLDNSTIVLNMFHDNSLLLGRSKNGAGTLKYEINEKQISWSCTVDDTTEIGKRALSGIERGDIDGCSFAFTYDWQDKTAVTRSEEVRDGKVYRTITVNKIKAMYDFCITPNPAYDATSCDMRDMIEAMRSNNPLYSPNPEPSSNDEFQKQDDEKRQIEIKKQIAEMRDAAKFRL